MVVLDAENKMKQMLYLQSVDRWWETLTWLWLRWIQISEKLFATVIKAKGGAVVPPGPATDLCCI